MWKQDKRGQGRRGAHHIEDEDIMGQEFRNRLRRYDTMTDMVSVNMRILRSK